MPSKIAERVLRAFRSETRRTSTSSGKDRKDTIVVRYFAEQEEVLAQLTPASVQPKEYNTFHIEDHNYDDFHDGNNRRNELCHAFDWGYVSVAFTNLLHVVATVTAQLLGVLFPLFEFNMLRCATQVCISVPVMIFYKETPTPLVSDFFKMCAVGFFYAAYMSLYFFATTYIPVGNLLAVWMTSCLCARGFYTLWAKACNVELSMSILVAISGIVMLVVPDYAFDDVKEGLSTPCPCVSATIPEYVSMATSMIDNDITTNGSSPDVHIPDGCLNYNLSWNVWEYFRLHHPQWLVLKESWMGYIFAVIAGFAHTACFIITEDLRQYYHYSVLVFWLGLIAGIMSTIGFIASETAVWPLDAACVILALLHCICVASDVILSLGVYGNVREEGLVLVTGAFIIVTFICQSTFLTHAFPWCWQRWNIIGALILLVGLLFSPLSTLWMDALNR